MPEPEGLIQLAMPEDGYEWRKYGQKYIMRIRKNRSYFKCRRNECGAKKRAEWPPYDPSNLRIVYDGAHNHPPLEALGPDSAPNPYDLRNQLLEQPNEPS